MKSEKSVADTRKYTLTRGMSRESENSRQLDELGYVVLEQLMGGRQLRDLRRRVDQLFDREGDLAGSEFKQEAGARRLANLMNKGSVFREVAAHETVLGHVGEILGRSFKLSSLNARSACPRSRHPQPLHCDMAAVADEHGYWVCNTVWMLDDFTAENGALRVVPGSHRWGQLPAEVMADPRETHPREVLLTGAAGSVIVTNAHVWHGGLANRTDQPRTAVHAFYCRRDKPQQQYQKQLLDADVIAGLTPRLRDLLAIDDRENDLLCQSPVARSGFLE